MDVTEQRLRVFGRIALMAILGGVLGLCAGIPFSLRRAPTVRKTLPLPHHFLHYPNGVSLRFAMAHDVIHERFPWHGPAYYEERNRRAREALKDEKTKDDGKPSARYWDLLDDLAVGLDRLGKHEEAIAVIADKLEEQHKLGMTGRDLYGGYANLGTFLILWQLDEGFADKLKAKQRIAESIKLIHQAVNVKPDAHFGREMWQSVLEEFLLASLDHPDLILEFDMIGNRLEQAVDPSKRRAFKHEAGEWTSTAYEANRNLADLTPEVSQRYRPLITLVGAEKGWPGPVVTDYKAPVPFDEPTLGIIGMWRYGGGANPHFALALGEIMLRVGQRYIAWTAYERAALLATQIGLPGKYVEHCRNRQAVIESQLPAEEVARLRPSFEQELAFGRAYQKDYQDYEARRIRDGASIDDPHFYDDFHKEHGSIASPIGEEDQFVVDRPVYITADVFLPSALLGAGVLAFLVTCVSVVRHRRRS
jgi:hypothetical protein